MARQPGDLRLEGQEIIISLKLLLKNLTWIRDEDLYTADIRIDGKKIVEIGDGLSPKRADKVIRFDNHYAYCGLTNSHDHLEMNLYQQSGNPPYHNYTAWAHDVYKPNESPVKEIEKIPIKFRLLWGGIKNLISGVTTVVHHNPWHYSLGNHFPVRVLKKYAWAHSLAFEKKLKSKFPIRKTTPFIIHAAEGRDSFARSEIDRLKKIGVLRANTVLIHAVAVDDDEIDLISQAGSSVVWCPSSNYYMFGQTAKISLLKERIPVALGTDSLMTGQSTLVQEMRVAKKSNEATAKEIFEMVTSTPQKIFNLARQKLAPGFPADMVIVPIKSKDYYENLIFQESAEVTCVLVDGQVYYADESLARVLSLKGFVQKVGNVTKWFGDDVNQLKMNILSTGIKEEFFEGNELWKFLS